MTYDLTGRIVGDLTVIEKLPYRNKCGKILYKVLCKCGNYKEVTTPQLMCKTRKLQSCGKCQWHITHKDAYISWSAAKQRCFDTGHKDYVNYGGRGIKFDSAWLNFVTFLEDMGDPPVDPISKERLSLDRTDNNGNYCKSNCKWSTRSEQQLNKREYRSGEEPFIKEIL